MSKKKRSWHTSLMAVLQLALMMATCSVAYQAQVRQLKISVEGETPGDFPILVITPVAGSPSYQATAVYQKDLERFLQENSEYSFLVPAGQDRSLNQQLTQWVRSSQNSEDFKFESADPGRAHFKVERLPDGRQLLEVFSTWDDDRSNTGWYEASEKEIVPKYHQSYFGPGMIMGTVMITGLVWGVGYIVYFVGRAVKRRFYR